MKKLFLLCMLCSLFFMNAKAQSETEPNDTWNQSQAITLGNTANGTAGLGQEQDWWRVSIPDDGALNVNWTSNGVLLYCEIYDTLGTAVLFSNYTNATSSGTASGIAKGTYYIRLFSFYGSDVSNYTVTPTFIPLPVANDLEPNGTYSTANTFALNSTTTGHCNYYFNGMKDTLDWYKITTTVSGKISWTITSHNGMLIYADLISGDGSTLITGNYTNNTLALSADGLAAGVYYIRLRTFYSNEYVPYTLSNTFTPPTNVSDPEPNQTAATATNFPLNGSIVGQIGYSYNGSRDDFDWWAVVVNADGRLDYSITSDNGQNLYATLYDGDGTTYLAGSYTTATANYSKDGLAPGTYYILVKTFYNYEFSSYSMTNNLVVPSVPNDIGSNNVFTNANTLPLNGSTTGHIGYRYNGTVDTTDWLKVTLPADGKLDWSITVANSQNVYAQLYDGNGTTFLGGSYTTSTVNFSKNGLAAGTYYIKMFTFYNSEFAPYTITNTFTPSPLTNDVEPNRSTATALSMAINSTVTGHIGYFYNGSRDTVDYYKVVLPVDGRFTFTITSENAANVFAILYDNNGTTYLAGSYTTNSATYARNDLAAGTYYIVISTFYDNEFSSYTLSNNLEPMTFLAEAPADNSSAINGTLLSANTTTGGHISFYYNLNADALDWWKIGYDGNGNMDLHLDIEQNHFNTDYPYIVYNLYSDTLAAPILSGIAHSATSTFSLTGLSTGVYYLRIDPGYGTFGAYSLQASYTELCANTVGISSSAQLPGCTGTITYNITGGLAPYTVQLYKDGSPTGSTQTTNGTITFNGLGLGTFYARSYSYGGSGICNNISGNTTFSSPVSPVISPVGSTIFCQGGSVTLSSTAASSYLWSTGATTQSIVVSTSGNYSVTTYNAAGCASEVSSSTTVTVNPLPATPAISAGTSTTFCQGGSVTLTSTPATSYLWSTGATTQSISVNATGSFSVTVSNANGCTASSSSTGVTVNPLPASPTITPTGSTTFCQGGNVILSSTSSSFYLWSNGATTQSITPTTNGTYSVRVTDANGCSATSSATTVTVNPLPTVTLSTFSSVCNTSGAFALAGGSPAGGTYSGTGVSGGMFNPATAGVGTFAITYSFTNANNCTNTATQSIDITNCAGCSSSITPSGPTTFCDGGSVMLTASLGVSYAWSNGATTQTITVSNSGLFSVTVTDANSCTSSASISVTKTTPVIASSSSTPILCNGGSSTVTVSATGGTAPYTGTGTFTQTTGTYSYMVTDAIGCTANTSITITQPTTVSASSSSTPILCNGGSSTVTVSASGGTAPYTGTGSFTQTSGTYSYTVTDANGCTSNTSITITQPTAVSASSSSTPILCNGGSSTVTVSASGGTAPYTGTGTFTRSAGSFTFTVTDANGCTSNTSITITQPTAVSASSSSTPILCFGGSSTVTVSATGGTAPYTGTGSFTQTAGSHSYTVTDANGCTANTSITITQPSKVEGTISTTPASGCSTPDGTATVTPIGGTPTYTYVWSNAQTTQTATGLVANVYSVTITDMNGCTGTATGTVSGSGGTIGTPGAISGPAGACRNSSGIVYSVDPVVGAISYTWTLPTGATGSSNTNSITVSFGPSYVGGFICVVANNACGSSLSSCLYIPVIAAYPSLPAVINGPSVACGPGVYTYSTSSANATSYNWTVSGAGVYIVSGQGQNTITVSVPAGFSQGSVQVRGVNCTGTSAVRGMTITGIPAHSNAVSGPSFVCANSTATYTMPLVTGGTTYTWSATSGATLQSSTTTNSTTSGTFVFDPSWNGGMITIEASNSCGSYSRTFTVRSTPVQPGGISGPGTAVCGMSNVTYSIAAVAGASSYTWTVPAGVSVVSTAPNGLSVVVNFTPAFTNSGSLCVTANNSCGQGPARCYIITARPSVPVITGPTSVCKSAANVAYTISPVTGATSYAWSVTGGASISPSLNTAIVNYNSAVSSTAVIRANAVNACGASQPGGLSVNTNLFCRTTADENAGENSETFTVYPNPTSTKATISFNTVSQQEYLIKVTDLLGNVLYTNNVFAQSDFNTTEIDMREFAKGIYLISVADSKGKANNMRIVVN